MLEEVRELQKVVYKLLDQAKAYKYTEEVSFTKNGGKTNNKQVDKHDSEREEHEKKEVETPQDEEDDIAIPFMDNPSELKKLKQVEKQIESLKRVDDDDGTIFLCIL